MPFGIDDVALIFGAAIAKEVADETVKKYGPAYARKLVKEMTHVQKRKKYCRVCGKLIKKNYKFALTRRFYCKKCGHRTHVKCAHSVSKQICKACAK